ncbi:MAG: SurA N-terminal domain-containing protein [Nitrospirales bacterium]
MIRLIREGSPWVIKGVILVIAVTFVIGMGWYGYEASQPNAVASVGPYTIDKQEYLRAKQRVYRFYRDQLKQEDVKDETLQQLALDGLVTNKSWRLLADEFGLAVSPLELHDAIVNQKDFQKDGVFDPEYYQRLLAANRTKPHEYEEKRREELLIEKARLLVSEATTLTPAELQEVKDLNDRQTLEGAESDPVVFEQIKMQFVLQKKQRAMQAFQAMLRARGDVTIHEELL